MRVFLSHASEDQALAWRIADRLRERGDEVRSSGESGHGEDWADHAADAIERSDAIIPIVTPEYLASPWASFEMGGSLSSDARLLPVVAKNATWDRLPAALRSIRGLVLSREGDDRRIAAQVLDALAPQVALPS